MAKAQQYFPQFGPNDQTQFSTTSVSPTQNSIGHLSKIGPIPPKTHMAHPSHSTMQLRKIRFRIQNPDSEYKLNLNQLSIVNHAFPENSGLPSVMALATLNN
jgi:hypothetical protein